MVAALPLLCVPLVWILLTCFETDIVLYQASRIADGRPYCIVVSDKNKEFSYKEATRRTDLSYTGLTTHLIYGGSGGPYADTFYALLVLQKPDEIRNWSKLLLDFEDDAQQVGFDRRKSSKLCDPAAKFVEHIH